MSKKKTKKFKHGGPHRPQINTPITQINEQIVQDPSGSTTTVATEVTSTPSLDEKYLYVRKDIKKILIFVGIIIVLLVGFYFLQTKTSVLNSFGDWIYKITGIQTG